VRGFIAKPDNPVPTGKYGGQGEKSTEKEGGKKGKGNKKVDRKKPKRESGLRIST